MKMWLLALAAVALVPSLTEGRTADVCELKEKLGDALALNPGLQPKKYNMAQMICGVGLASSFNTSAVTTFHEEDHDKRRSKGRRRNHDHHHPGSSYGLFQLSDKYHCDSGGQKTLNACNKPCSAFTDDDITDDIDCFLRTHGLWRLVFDHCETVQDYFANCE